MVAKSSLFPARIPVLAFGLVAVGLGVYLVVGPKPWDLRIPEGGEMKVRDYVTVYSWIAAAINFSLTLLLAATARWWLRPSSFIKNPSSNIKYPAWFLPLTVLAMAVTAWLGWPRLGQSVWHDEGNRVKNTISGQFKPQSDGSYKFRPVNWQTALFAYELPNHILQTALSKVANDAWRVVARPSGLQFSEVAIRVPCFLAGIASVGLLALLGWRLGQPAAGVLAAFLVAVHPWHIRYATEARAYALVLALLPALLIFLLNAVETGKWRWWIAFAFAEFCLVYSYATSFWIVLVASLGVPVALWARSGRSGETGIQVLRWLVTGTVAGMLLLQLMLPCLPQLFAYASESRGVPGVDMHWLRNFFSHLLAGIPWSYTYATDSRYLELMPWFGRNPAIGAAIWIVVALACLGGGVRLVRPGLPRLLAPVILLVPAGLLYAEATLHGRLMHEWYLIFLLPGAVLLFAIGIDGLTRRAGFTLALGAFCVAAFAAWTTPQRLSLRTVSLQPDRESVQLTRPTLDPNDGRQKHILTATFFSPPGPYDPRIKKFRTVAELRELMERADRDDAALYINLGFLETVRAEHPRKYALVQNAAVFDEVALLPGFYPALDRHVFRYRRGSAAGFDFSAAGDDVATPDGSGGDGAE